MTTERSRRVLEARRWLTLLMLCAGFPAVAAGQTMNPTRAEFTPSPDHDASANGSPIVSSYQLEFFLSGAQQPFQSNPIGKPSPDTDGMIRVDLTNVLVGWPVPGTVYVATVSAIGPGGSTRSAPSNTFQFTNPCSYTISPTSAAPAAAGGSTTVTIDTTDGCAWQAVSNDASWLTLTSAASGSGDGSVTYSVAQNTASARSGTLTIAGRTHTVNQAGACTYAVTPTSQSVPGGGGSFTASVDTQTGCAWSASESLTWVSISNGGPGTGDGTVTYTVSASSSSSPRSGSITVAGRTVAVTQDRSCSSSTALSPTSASPAAAGGSATITVTADPGCAWTASESSSWITLSSPTSGTGNGTVSYTVAANTGSARTDTIAVGSRSFSVSQAAGTCSVIPSRNAVSIPTAGTAGSLTVTSGCSWTASSNAGWLTVTAPANGSGSGSGTVSYSATANTGTTTRTATLTIGNATVSFSQAPPQPVNPPTAPGGLRIVTN